MKTRLAGPILVLFSTVLAVHPRAQQPSWTFSSVATPNASARPAGVTVASSVPYFSDATAHTVNGVTVAGTFVAAGLPGSAGNADGTAAAIARLAGPSGIAVDAAGNIFVADAGSGAIRRVAPDGTVSTFAGRNGTAGPFDGTASAARFNFPQGIALDSSGNLFVADQNNCTIRRITPSAVVTTIAGLAGRCGAIDGSGSAARFTAPTDVAVDGAGGLVVADAGAHRIRRVSATGVVTTLAGSGEGAPVDGTGAGATFSLPLSVVVDPSGNVYVGDYGGSSSRIRKVTPAGVVTTVAQISTAGGSPTLAISPGGVLYAAVDRFIMTVAADGTVTTVAGGGSGDGTGTAAGFTNAGPIAFDASGALYIVDGNGSLRRMTPQFVVETLLQGVAVPAGTPRTARDGAGRAAARLNQPDGLVALADGSIAIADTGNNTIRRLRNNVITTIATGLSSPRGLALDSSGNIIVADSGTNSIRRVTTSGVVTTVATGFHAPRGVAAGSDGVIYVADTGSHTIRAISAAGAVTTLAGLADSPGSPDGAGAAARFSSPAGIALQPSGLLIVTDTGNHTIRAVTTTGVVSTIGGAAGQSGSADGSGSVARFAGPAGIFAGPDGTVYIADTGNGAIRVGVAGPMTTPAITTQPVPQTGDVTGVTQFTCAASGAPAPLYQWKIRSPSLGTFNITDDDVYSGVQTSTLTISRPRANLSGSQYFCVASNAAGSVESNAATLTLGAFSASPRAIIFGMTTSADGATRMTPAEAVAVNWTGSNAPAWSASADASWLQIANGSGNGTGRFTVTATNPGLAPGATATATITVTSVDPELTVRIAVTLRSLVTSTAPIGTFETPANNATALQGSVAVTGWALDDINVDHVEIWRDRVAGETTPVYPGSGPGNGKIFIATTTFVPGARPDVEALYASTYAGAARAGWGYMLLTQGLWNQGNGTYTLYAFGFDAEGNTTTLGTKTISVDNAHATKPFGAIDTPGQGGTASGLFTNFGWALTPGACVIPGNGVQVSIDSGPLQAVSYGDVRADIAGAFVGYTNGAAAGGHYTFDTTTLANGLHTIGWIATDSCGRADGIGSRFFTVSNGASTSSAVGALGPQSRAPAGDAAAGFSLRGDAGRRVSAGELPAAADGTRVIRMEQNDRIEVQLPDGDYAVGRLPIGSSFDRATGTFRWQPAAGFLGAYGLDFTAGARTERLRVVVGPPVRMAIDTARAGDVLSASGFTLAGWAVDLASLDGAGVDTLHAWAYPVGGGEPVFVGVAEAGGTRPDVASLYGAAFAGAGFTLTGTLAPGTYDLVVFAHSAALNTFAGAETVRVVVK